MKDAWPPQQARSVRIARKRAIIMIIIIIKVILARPMFLLMVLISVCVAGQGWLLIGGEWCSAAIRRQRERISEDGQRECVHGLLSFSSEPCFAHETPEHCPMNGLIQPSLHKTAAAIVQTQAPPPNKVLCRCNTFFISTIRLCDTKRQASNLEAMAPTPLKGAPVRFINRSAAPVGGGTPFGRLCCYFNACGCVYAEGAVC
jgi:hypothetical protein